MKVKGLIKDILEVLISVFLICFILINFVIYPCQVDGSSMYPTLKNDQKGYAFVFSKYFGIERFDICILKVKDGDENKLIVKRVIGLPGETIQYQGNKLFVDGEYVQEDFLDDVYTEDLSITLGEDEYFCLGDNRPSSKDSRYYGTFKYKDFKALNFLTVSPISEFGLK